jgi:hypothetical protein
MITILFIFHCDSIICVLTSANYHRMEQGIYRAKILLNIMRLFHKAAHGSLAEGNLNLFF